MPTGTEVYQELSRLNHSIPGSAALRRSSCYTMRCTVFTLVRAKEGFRLCLGDLPNSVLMEPEICYLFCTCSNASISYGRWQRMCADSHEHAELTHVSFSNAIQYLLLLYASGHVPRSPACIPPGLKTPWPGGTCCQPNNPLLPRATCSAVPSRALSPEMGAAVQRLEHGHGPTCPRHT